MKKINGYWVDENNNRWDCEKYTKKKAEGMKKTLVATSECVNCEKMFKSYDCNNCSDCQYLFYGEGVKGHKLSNYTNLKEGEIIEEGSVYRFGDLWNGEGHGEECLVMGAYSIADILTITFSLQGELEKLSTQEKRQWFAKLTTKEKEAAIQNAHIIVRSVSVIASAKPIKYGYCRVSTKWQLKGNSIEEQRTAILSMYQDARIIEESVSGAKDREIFNNLVAKVKAGDMIVVTKLDRFCRQTKEGLEYMDILLKKDVKLHILNMGLVEDSPMGRLIATNLLAFAEFERAMIIERTQAGLEIARQREGYVEGRPKKFTPEQIQHAVSLLETNSYSKVVKLTGISKSTIIRAVRDEKKKQTPILDS